MPGYPILVNLLPKEQDLFTTKIKINTNVSEAIEPFCPSKTLQRIKTVRHVYRSSESICKNCAFRAECCGKKTKFKRIERSEHHDLYLQMHNKLTENERYARRMRRLRSSTVEPVLGTLINFLGMKKVNTRGIAQAEKHVLMASLCYNLKKMLKFKPKKSEIMAIALQKSAQLTEQIFLCFFGLIIFVLKPNKPSFFPVSIACKKINLA